MKRRSPNVLSVGDVVWLDTDQADRKVLARITAVAPIYFRSVKA